MKNENWDYIDVWSKKIRAYNLLGGKCNKCDDDNVFHLCFHHKNNDKEFNTSKIRGHRWSKIKKEIEKCDLMCMNCHQELHVKDNIGDESYRINKQIYLEYKGQKCQKCGYDECQASLTFHHINPEEKIFIISDYSNRVKTINDLDKYITDELNKCDILCHNCHGETHTDINKFNSLKEQIYYKVDNFKEQQRKISRDDVKIMYESGMKQVEIAKHFNASKGTISDIIKKIKCFTY